MDNVKEQFIESYFLHTSEGWQVVALYKRIRI